MTTIDERAAEQAVACVKAAASPEPIKSKLINRAQYDRLNAESKETILMLCKIIQRQETDIELLRKDLELLRSGK